MAEDLAEYRYGLPADQAPEWFQRPWYICTSSGEWFCMLCGKYAMLGHLQSSMHQLRLTEATRIPEASWIQKHRKYIAHYVRTYRPQRWSLQGLDEIWSAATPECLSRCTAAPPGPPPSPPPLFFVTVPSDSLLWEQYKRFLHKNGVVDYSGNLI